MKGIILLTTYLLLVVNVIAQSNIEGRWKTIDDKTGEMKSVVLIEIKNGKLFGKIVELSGDVDPGQLCTKCTDDRRGKKVLGMQIITALKNDDGVWEGDNAILDPENGKIYDCKIWLEKNQLKVRGYISFLYRTQTWLRE